MLTDSIMVETPSLIVDGKIFTDDRKLPYSNKLFQRDSRFKGQITDITLPQGQSEVIIKLEYRKRKVSYTLHLTNNRTKESKFISGKWIESAPTGNYEIEWQQ